MLFLGAAERSFCDNTKAAPQLMLEQQIHDFKDVIEGEVLTHTFEFKIGRAHV